METEEVLNLKKQLIEISHNAMLLEEKLHQSVKFFSEPKLNESNSWWTGRDRVMDFASWGDAHRYWELKRKNK